MLRFYGSFMAETKEFIAFLGQNHRFCCNFMAKAIDFIAISWQFQGEKIDFVEIMWR